MSYKMSNEKLFDINEVKISAMNRPKSFKDKFRLLLTKDQYVKDDCSDWYIRFRVLDGIIYVMGEAKLPIVI